MVKSMIHKLKDLDKAVIKIMESGILSGIWVCMISVVLLLTYQFLYHSPNLYEIGLQTFRTGLLFIVAFIICGVGVDTIKKEIG